MIAAFVVLGLVSGRRGVAELWRQMREWRVSWRWYLIAPSIFLGVHGVALILASSVGLQVATPSAVWTLSALLATAIPLVFLGGQWEEPGWLGYLLRRLSGFRPLVIALQVIVTWLYTRTGSLLIPMLAHLFSNLTMAFSRVLVAESQLDRYWLIVMLVEVPVAVGSWSRRREG